jgi:hypothetical protein
MSKIYADVDKRKYTHNRHFAQAYKRKNPDADVRILHLAKIKQNEVEYEVTAPKGAVAYALVTQAKHEQVMSTPSMFDLWILAGFDSRDYDTHRLSVDGTQGLFRIRIKNQAVKDRLESWKAAGHIVDWLYYNHQEYDVDGNPTDTTIKEFLSGNADWESEVV